MYYLLVYVIDCMYVYCCALLLAMCSWVDVDPSEEPQDQYQYPEQPTSEHFEQQQEQYEEGKYNMNYTYHFKYNFILYFNTVCL